MANIIAACCPWLSFAGELNVVWRTERTRTERDQSREGILNSSRWFAPLLLCSTRETCQWTVAVQPITLFNQRHLKTPSSGPRPPRLWTVCPLDFFHRDCLHCPQARANKSMSNLMFCWLSLIHCPHVLTGNTKQDIFTSPALKAACSNGLASMLVTVAEIMPLTSQMKPQQ